MWFRKKTRNRRLSRAQVLDVKLRSSQVRAARTRFAAISLGLIFGTVFGLYLVWRGGEWALDRLVYQNSSFAIRNISIQTDGVISTDQLQRWSGVKIGENLFALDLSQVRRNLLMAPLIKSVSVERILPRALHISVAEREPVAQIDVPGLRPGGGVIVHVFQVDADGFVMLPLDPRQRAMSLGAQTGRLPVISGLNPVQLHPGRSIDSPQLQAALNLISAFQCSPMVGLVNLQRVDVSSPEVLVAVTDHGSQITFSTQNLDQQLRRWREIYDLGQRMNRAIATLNLAVSNNIPARWMEMSALPPVSHHSVPPSRTKIIRKRNV